MSSTKHTKLPESNNKQTKPRVQRVVSLHPEFLSSGGRLPEGTARGTHQIHHTVQTGAMQSRQNAYPPSGDSRPKPRHRLDAKNFAKIFRFFVTSNL
jgi:hypothetical protein